MKPSSTAFLLLLLLHSAAAAAASPPSPSTLDPKQLQALQSLYIPTTHDPCAQPSFHNATTCDAGTPFRHLLSLRLTNCSDDLSLSTTALSSLSTLTSLTFSDCHVTIVHFPSSLSTNLRSLTSINSLRRLSGVFLSRFTNLTELTISGDTIKASGIHIITSKMESLTTITLSNTNLTGSIPKHLNNNNPKLTHIDFSGNRLNGSIPTSLTLLETLKFLNLSSNQLNGEIPSSFGDLISLQNLSLSSNSLSGSIPGSISNISRLAHLDLSSNQLNGTIPRSISEMKGLKYLNLENNNFHGIMPFSSSFIKTLEVFKIKGNDNLCYNHTSISKKLKLGIAACDKHGLPILPPPADEPSSSADDLSSGDYDDGGGDNEKKKSGGDHGPNKVVLGVAIGLSAVVFLIIFLVILSKCGVDGPTNSCHLPPHFDNIITISDQLNLITLNPTMSLSSTTTFLLLLLLHSAAASLDPKQLRALRSLYIPTTHDPCTQPSFHNATTCDAGTPFRHLLSLRLTNCAGDLSLSTAALSSLSTLTSLIFNNCHVPIVHFPSSLSTNLRSLTSINSLRRLSGVFLSRFTNLTGLTISGDKIKASGIHIITSNMKSLTTVTLSNTNLTGSIPKHWNPKLTHIDFSDNRLNGIIPTSLTLLDSLKFLNLSSNQLNGEIPKSFGYLISLQNLSLSSNSLSGSIPGSISNISRLAHLDLSSNQLNGTIPRSISEMKGLKYLNLENNNFHGIMPFSSSFIKTLEVFKIKGNDNLCYNHTSVSKKLKLGIAVCDKHGLPILPPPADEPSSSADDLSSGDYDDQDMKKSGGDHGPNKVVLGVAIGLSAVVFLIIFLVILSKCGGRSCGCC
ncbi:hypothetical protein SSX86_009900 [Deinandra increscens subsp. villosa]|uniref:Receptor-like protein 51 n=1 Tax=Deinandra increscens subsp. villosa TaxID=3103831 RepID=A0AAP0DEL8_9ASTR